MEGGPRGGIRPYSALAHVRLSDMRNKFWVFFLPGERSEFGTSSVSILFGGRDDD